MAQGFSNVGWAHPTLVELQEVQSSQKWLRFTSGHTPHTPIVSSSFLPFLPMPWYFLSRDSQVMIKYHCNVLRWPLCSVLACSDECGTLLSVSEGIPFAASVKGNCFSNHFLCLGRIESNIGHPSSKQWLEKNLRGLLFLSS